MSSKIDANLYQDAHQPLKSPVLRPRARGQDRRKHFKQNKCQRRIRRCSVEHAYSVFRVFGLILNFVKRFSFWDTRRTDGRTRDLFERQSEVALLVKQEKPSSNFDEAWII